MRGWMVVTHHRYNRMVPSMTHSCDPVSVLRGISVSLPSRRCSFGSPPLLPTVNQQPIVRHGRSKLYCTWEWWRPQLWYPTNHTLHRFTSSWPSVSRFSFIMHSSTHLNILFLTLRYVTYCRSGRCHIHMLTTDRNSWLFVQLEW